MEYLDLRRYYETRDVMDERSHPYRRCVIYYDWAVVMKRRDCPPVFFSPRGDDRKYSLKHMTHRIGAYGCEILLMTYAMNHNASKNSARSPKISLENEDREFSSWASIKIPQ